MRPKLLTIAGFDPCGGAGILADVKTAEAMGVTAMAVVTVLTYQNEKEVMGTKILSDEEVIQQLKPLEIYDFQVVKIGVLSSLTLFEKIIIWLKVHNPEIKIVWDPVLSSSSGFSFLDINNVDLLHSIIKDVYLLTPNRPEQEQLEKKMGSQLSKLTRIIEKGGHKVGVESIDRLVWEQGQQDFQGQRGPEKHGTGCVFSSAIAAGLAKGQALPQAVANAKAYVSKFIFSSPSLLGDHDQ